tara:strand:+ start:6970 stop:7581 length:612 start_codon:yes stop_codon:yes gene_type:complete
VKKLWQYGCSISLGEEATSPYGLLAARCFGYEFVQQSESSASNPYIATKFCEQYKDITKDDLVIFGWSHPSRNSWYSHYLGKWEHLNYIQQKRRGSLLTESAVDYVTNQYSSNGYIENLHSWFPKHVVSMTCKVAELNHVHIDMLPNMGSLYNPRQFTGWSSAVEHLIKEDKLKYIADHLHPNDLGHERIFNLIKPFLISFIT